jgi:hypothetical protein
VQWPFADFLMSPAARNWFFGTHYLAYMTPPTSLYARFQFIPAPPPAEFWRGMAIALAVTCGFAYLGVHVGRAMLRVRR